MTNQTKRVHNFNPGPAVLPKEVLQTVQAELLDYRGTGMSVLEISHRSAEYEEINNQAMALFHELMGLGDNYKIAFVGGGLGLLISITVVKLVWMIPINSDSAMQYLGRPMLSATVIITSISILTLIGLLAGFFPARKAASVDPVTALRYE